MKLFVPDCEITGLDICQRAVAAGHEVRWMKHWGKDLPKPVGEGFDGIKFVDDIKDGLSWVGKDGLVLLTGNARWMDTLDRYREFGFQIFGPTKASAQLEINRSKGMDLMKSVGIDIPSYEMFGSLDEAEAFAKKSDKSWVFKPLGDCEDKDCTYISKSPADMVGWIRRKKAQGFDIKGQCMLQEKVEVCCEIGISGWVGPDGFLPDKFQTAFEHKRLMNDEKGPATGEMCTVTKYNPKDKLAEEMLLPFQSALQALGHRGDFAINCILDDKGKLWPLEFTSRLGWPAFFIQTASHRGDPIQWMAALLKGEDTLKVDERVAIGVVLGLPPFPQWNGSYDRVVGLPIEGLDKNWRNIHPVMMKMGKGPYMDGDKVKEGKIFQTSGELPVVVTGLGDTVTSARKAVYKVVDDISFSSRMYRTDAGCKLESQLPKCHAAGYAEAIFWGDEE